MKDHLELIVDLPKRLAPGMCHILSVNDDLTLCYIQQACNQLGNRGFAGTGFPHDSKDLARHEPETDVIDCGERRPAGLGENFGDIPYL